jgi:hypothetical protein
MKAVCLLLSLVLLLKIITAEEVVKESSAESEDLKKIKLEACVNLSKSRLAKDEVFIYHSQKFKM